MTRGTTALILTLLLGPTVALAQAPDEVLAEHGCTACHTLDGSEGPGPSFLGLFERTSEVSTDGQVRRVRVDDDYVARSIREPDHDLVTGYDEGRMPALGLDDAQVASVLEALHALPAEVDATPRTLLPLALGCLGFLLLHLGLSFHPVRSRLIERLGPKWFERVYSIAVLVPFGLIFWGWSVRPYVELYTAPSWAGHLTLSVMPFAFFFLIAGYTTKNPTMAGQGAALEAGPRGVVTITRHPALWGFLLWATSHLLPNGDVASVLLFGSFGCLALLGMLHIDRRRERALGDRWAPFRDATSIVPFVAILRGRTRLDVGGLWWRALLALAAYLGMLAIHEWEFGVSPLPPGLAAALR